MYSWINNTDMHSHYVLLDQTNADVVSDFHNDHLLHIQDMSEEIFCFFNQKNLETKDLVFKNPVDFFFSLDPASISND